MSRNCNCSNSIGNYSQAQIEDMKSFAKEKLYIEHCLPADIKAKSNERIAKTIATVAFVYIGVKYTSKLLGWINNKIADKKLEKKLKEQN